MEKLRRALQLYPVTLGCAALCVIVYLLMVYSGAHFADPHNQALIAWGGNYRPATVDGQGWRLLTAIFIHGGWLHLCLNMLALLDIGHLLEQKIGRRMLLVIFVLSGLVGSLCTLSWHPYTVGVGASGAIMGLAGALVVWLALPKLARAQEIERKVQVRALVMGLTLTLGVGAYSQRIDNAAHVGGLLTGLVLGTVVYAMDRMHPGAIKRWLAALTLLYGGLILVWYALRLHSPDEYRFRKSLPQVEQILNQYADVHGYMRRSVLLAETSRGDARQALDRAWANRTYQQGIDAWQQCLQTTQAWRKMQLTPVQARLAGQLLSYCGLRQQQYRALQQVLHSAPSPAAQREMGLLLQQTTQIERQLLPVFYGELALYRQVQAQMGMNLRGKPRESNLLQPRLPEK